MPMVLLIGRLSVEFLLRPGATKLAPQVHRMGKTHLSQN